MSNTAFSRNALLLRGLDGSNPLGFLAALGTLRALTDSWPNRGLTMSWTRDSGAWRPVLHFSSSESTEEVTSALSAFVAYRSLFPSARIVRHRLRVARGARALQRMEKKWARRKLSKQEKKEKKQFLQKLIGKSRDEWLQQTHPYLLVGKNTNVPSREYRVCLLRIARATKEPRLVYDQFAALGSDIADEDGSMLDTALRTMSGSGHQHQLVFMANLLQQVTPDAIRRSLFERWDYADPVRNLTLRLDPMDDSRYALQWENPSTDPTRDHFGSMLGANALAVIGLSLVSTVPVTKGLATLGFSGTGSRDTFWTWPIWGVSAGVDVVRSLLAHSQLQPERFNGTALRAMGIAVVYRAQRISVDKFRNFTPSHPATT